MIPQTGQSTCYDQFGVIISCVGTGQDGDLKTGVAWPTPRFTNNGDQTVTDNLTGLIWTKDANLMTTRDPGFDVDINAANSWEVTNDGMVFWQHALDYIQKLNRENYLGHSDWRLPNRNELFSLTNPEAPSFPYWPNSQGFSNVQYDYWSSTPETGGNGIWTVSTALSNEYAYLNTNTLFVWPVRGGRGGASQATDIASTGQTVCYDGSSAVISCTGTGQDGELKYGKNWPSPRFRDNSDQTVADNLTGLYWSKDGNPGGEPRNWQQALDYISKLNVDNYLGHGDWRLPNRNELRSLINMGEADSSVWLNNNGFYSVQGTYWTCNSHTGEIYHLNDDGSYRISNANANGVNLNYGYMSAYEKSTKYYVWPVRGGYGNVYIFPPSTTFSAAISGGPTSFATFNIFNNSNTALTVSAMTITGNDASQFSVSPGGVNPCTSLTPVLEPGAGCTVTVSYTPVSPGDKSATLTVMAGVDGATLLKAELAVPGVPRMVPLPQTGQTGCYDVSGDSIACTGTGLDGDLKTGVIWPTPRFSDNGNQTVTDKLTGLIWSKNTDPSSGTKTWQQALDYIKSLNSQKFLGFNDWRLPNRIELESLINSGESSYGAWLATNGFINVRTGYWSSSTVFKSYSNGYAWALSLNDGSEQSYYNKITSKFYVWPVRTAASGSLLAKTGQITCADENGTIVTCAGTGQDGDLQSGVTWPKPRFTDNSDQTVTDKLTGLVWSKDGNLMTSRDPAFDADFTASSTSEKQNDGLVSWQHALDYIQKLNRENYLGYSDWRMPNINELKSLVNLGQASPASWLNGNSFANAQANYYWSSTEQLRYSFGNVRSVNMYDGTVYDTSPSSKNHLWPVRSGQYGTYSPFTLSTASASFDTTNYNQQSTPVSFTLGNSGTGSIAVSAIATVGGDASHFVFALGGATPCSSLTPVLAAGTSCTVTVSFAPLSPGIKNALLQLTTDTPGAAVVSVPLTGTSPTPLTRTGQTSCYNVAGTAVSCADTGQDGDAKTGTGWPSPRFTDNGDQTVTDNMTGLAWSTDASPAARKSYSWQQALDYVITLNSQNYLGHNDWRLPNIKELKSLVNLEVSVPATWLNSQGFSGIRENYYWSSTSHSDLPYVAWMVIMTNGETSPLYKTRYGYVLSVRSGKPDALTLSKTGQTSCYNAEGGDIACSGTGQDGELQIGAEWPNPRFATNADTTVTDSLTGLTWSADGAGTKSWQQAFDYVEGLNNQNYLGFADWRLPNRNELDSLINYDKDNYSWLETQGFDFSLTTVQSAFYWTSTSIASQPASAWIISFVASAQNYGYKSSNFNVRAVRGGYFAMYPSLVTFTPTSRGAQQTPVIVTLANGGATAASISSVGIVGADADQFGVTPGGPSPCASMTPVIAAGKSCTVKVGFSPTSSGIKNATLQVTGDAVNGRTLQCSLSGTGIFMVSAGTFDGATVPALPSGWLSSGSGAAWAVSKGTKHPSGVSAHSPDNLVYFNSYTVVKGKTALLISPSFSLANTSDVTVSFWMYRDSGYATAADLINVYVNTQSTLTGAALLGTVNRSISLSPEVHSTGWYQYTFNIPGSYAGTGNFLIFQGIGDDGNDIHLDDISVYSLFSSSAPMVTLAENTFDTLTTPLLPAGWVSSGSEAAWSSHNGTMNPSGIDAYSPGNLVYFNSYYVAPGKTADLISPLFSLAGVTGARASFWMYRDSGYSYAADRLNVYVNTTPGLEGALLLGTVNRSMFLDPIVGIAGWYQYWFDIPPTYNGTVNYLLINGVSGYGNDIHLDNIRIYGRNASGSGSSSSQALPSVTFER